MINRRAALAGVMGLFGTAVFAPIARAAGQLSPPPVISDGAPSTPVFSATQRELVKALSERILPTTDTPGAIAAGVPEFIEKMLADWALPADRVPILAGLDAIEGRSQQDFKLAATKAAVAQQDALLTLAMNGEIPAGKPFFEAFRQLVIAGYYTSEIGMTQEREYLPIPGKYDGEYLYANVNKVFSA